MPAVTGRPIRLLFGALLVAGALAAPQTAAGADPVLCDGEVATVVGTAGADVLTGTAQRDVITGLAGDDLIEGLGGADLICAGAGRDEVRAGPGRDQHADDQERAEEEADGAAGHSGHGPPMGAGRRQYKVPRTGTSPTG